MLGKFKQKLLNTKLISFLMKKRYDCIVPIGQGCMTICFLEKYKLRKSAYPLDWTFIPSYNSSINLIKTKFDNYFKRDDLEFCHYDEINNTDVYKNTRNNIVHIHVFPPNSKNNFDYYYIETYNKYQRRVKRFLDFTNKKNTRVLLLFIERASDDEWIAGLYKEPCITNEILEQDVNLLNKIYKKNIFDILYVKHDDKLKLNEYKLNGRILYINNTYKVGMYGNHPCYGNYLYLSNILSRMLDVSMKFKLAIYTNNFIKKVRITLHTLKINTIY